jgi:hypothetical protein
MIVYEDSPLGMLIDACTRFGESCALACPRTCAARLDRKEHPEERVSVRLHIGDTTTFDLRLP